MKDYIVSAPGQHLVIVSANNVRQARASARQAFAIGKLPKGTVIEEYSETSWNNTPFGRQRS